MTLKDQLAQTGGMLFRWRSYPPLLFLGIVLFALRSFTYPGGSEAGDYIWEAVCLIPVLAGLLVRAWALGQVAPGTSGGNRSRQVAESLNTTGLYSIVRHPLYLGNLLIWIGVAMFPRSVGVVLIVALLFTVYYERIMLAEEAFLESKFGAAFTEWADRVPAILPNPSLWQPSATPFSVSRVVRRDFSAWLAAAASLFVLEVASDYGALGSFALDRIWVVGLLVVITGSLVARLMKTHRRSG